MKNGHEGPNFYGISLYISSYCLTSGDEIWHANSCREGTCY